MDRVYIWLDDVRPCAIPPIKCEYGLITRDYESAIRNIEHYKNSDKQLYIDFDHDLGEGKSGYDVAKWIVENHVYNVHYRVHSMNPIGRQNIEQLLDHYGYKKF